METDKFCLRWNDFESNISSAFKELREDKNFFDVTIACDDEHVQAHKVILAACSQFFRNILCRHPHQHPLLYLKGVKYSELQSVLNFMYHGEVNIAQENLNSFLAVAEDLRVKGLTQKQHDSQIKKRSYETLHKKEKRVQENPTNKSIQLIQEEDVHEVVTIKSEPNESQIHVYNGSQALVNTTEQNVTKVHEEEDFQEFQEYEEDQQQQHYIDHGQNRSHGLETGPGRTCGGREDEFENFLKQNSGQVEGGTWTCYLCGKITSASGNMRQHFEAYHFSLGGVQCDLCMKIFKTKHSLATHVYKVHKNK